MSLVLCTLSACTNQVEFRGDGRETPEVLQRMDRNAALKEIAASIDDASKFLAEWGSVSISAPMVSIASDDFQFAPNVTDAMLVSGQGAEGGALREAWKATSLAIKAAQTPVASISVPQSTTQPDTSAAAKEAHESEQKRLELLWSSLDGLSQRFPGNQRRRYRNAASDRFEIGLHTFLSDPERTLPDWYRPVYMVFTVHCQPGWRTREGYVGRVNVEAQDIDPSNPDTDNPSSRAAEGDTYAPLVSALYPASESQELLLVNSDEQRSQNRLGGDTTYASIAYSSDGGNGVAASTRTTLNTTTAFISGGQNFGYEFRPTYRATRDLEGSGSTPGTRLDPVAFPAVAIVGLRERPYDENGVDKVVDELRGEFEHGDKSAYLSSAALVDLTKHVNVAEGTGAAKQSIAKQLLTDPDAAVDSTEFVFQLNERCGTKGEHRLSPNDQHMHVLMRELGPAVQACRERFVDKNVAAKAADGESAESTATLVFHATGPTTRNEMQWLMYGEVANGANPPPLAAACRTRLFAAAVEAMNKSVTVPGGDGAPEPTHLRARLAHFLNIRTSAFVTKIKSQLGQPESLSVCCPDLARILDPTFLTKLESALRDAISNAKDDHMRTDEFFAAQLTDSAVVFATPASGKFDNVEALDLANMEFRIEARYALADLAAAIDSLSSNDYRPNCASNASLGKLLLGTFSSERIAQEITQWASLRADALLNLSNGDPWREAMVRIEPHIDATRISGASVAAQLEAAKDDFKSDRDVRQVVNGKLTECDRASKDYISERVAYTKGQRRLRLTVSNDWRRVGAAFQWKGGFTIPPLNAQRPESQAVRLVANLDRADRILDAQRKEHVSGSLRSDLKRQISSLRRQLVIDPIVIQLPNIFEEQRKRLRPYYVEVRSSTRRPDDRAKGDMSVYLVGDGFQRLPMLCKAILGTQDENGSFSPLKEVAAADLKPGGGIRQLRCEFEKVPIDDKRLSLRVYLQEPDRDLFTMLIERWNWPDASAQ